MMPLNNLPIIVVIKIIPQSAVTFPPLTQPSLQLSPRLGGDERSGRGFARAAQTRRAERHGAGGRGRGSARSAGARGAAGGGARQGGAVREAERCGRPVLGCALHNERRRQLGREWWRRLNFHFIAVIYSIPVPLPFSLAGKDFFPSKAALRLYPQMVNSTAEGMRRAQQAPGLHLSTIPPSFPLRHPRSGKPWGSLSRAQVLNLRPGPPARGSDSERRCPAQGTRSVIEAEGEREGERCLRKERRRRRRKAGLSDVPERRAPRLPTAHVPPPGAGYAAPFHLGGLSPRPAAAPPCEAAVPSRAPVRPHRAQPQGNRSLPNYLATLSLLCVLSRRI